MKRLFWLLLLAILLSAAVPGLAQTLEFTNRTDPVSLIGAYYNAISRSDYQRAYSYWETPPDNATLEQFAAGFADTLSAQAFVRLPVVTDAGAGNLFASLPTLVIATRTDGSRQMFAGCFIAHRTNVPVGDATEPDPNWSLRDATLQPQSALNFAALDNVCEQSASLEMFDYSLASLDPRSLLVAYFSALDLGDVVRASSYWEDQSKDIMNTVFGRYFTGAQSVGVYVDPQMFTEGVAGSVFARVRTLALVTAAGGDVHVLPICFTTRRSNVPVGNAPDPNWFFFDTRIIEAASVTDTVELLPLICG